MYDTCRIHKVHTNLKYSRYHELWTAQVKITLTWGLLWLALRDYSDNSTLYSK